jgi:hypothetical protein
MARVKVYRELPPLKEAMAHFKGFPNDRSRQQTVIDELRVLAKKIRGKKPVPFYAMREVADFFAIPLGMLSVAYQALERETLLIRLRGSRTMLTGKAVLARDVIRGVVGVPIWLNSILTLPYTAVYLMEVEEQLRRAGFVADIIFHDRKDEEADPSFAARLLRHRLDAVIWHSPFNGSQQNIFSIAERGVKPFIIQQPDAPRNIPGVIYLTGFRNGYETLAKTWRSGGIRKVWLWTPPVHLHHKSESTLFLSIMKEQGIAVTFTEDEPRVLLKKIRSEKKIRAGVAFLDTTNCERLCNHEPYVIESISRAARLAFCMGIVRVPFLQHRGVKVDVVGLSARKMAARLVTDIGRMSMINDGVCHTFEAEFQEMRPFGEMESPRSEKINRDA